MEMPSNQMTALQRKRPDLIYQLNHSIFSILKEHQGIVSFNYYNPRWRSIHWLTVHEECWDEKSAKKLFDIYHAISPPKGPQSINEKKLVVYSEKLQEKIEKLLFPETWESYLDEGNTWETYLHHAMMLYQKYPIAPNQCIDGILLSRFKKDPIRFAVAELLEEHEAAYYRIPPVKLRVWFGKKNPGEEPNETLWGFQEMDLDENPSDHVYETQEEFETALENESNDRKEIGRQNQSTVFDPLWGHFTRRETKGRVLSKILVIPCYDIFSQGKPLGVPRLILQIPFENEREIEQLLKAINGKKGEFLQIIQKSALQALLRPEGKRDQALLSLAPIDLFLENLCWFQDWEAVRLVKKEGETDICHRRQRGEKTKNQDRFEWKECDKIKKGNCADCPLHKALQKIESSQEEDHFKIDANAFSLIKIRDFFNQATLSQLEENYLEDIQDFALLFQYPDQTLFSSPSPGKKEIEEVWNAYVPAQLEIMQQIILRKSLVDSVIRHGSKAAATSIMTRNLSHNLGSHVLNYWNTLDMMDAVKAMGKIRANKCIPKEFKTNSYMVEYALNNSLFLFQYLQTRTDFLAEMATSYPSWEHTMEFATEVMTGPYHRLRTDPITKYISFSEGLGTKDEYDFWIGLGKGIKIKGGKKHHVSIPNGIVGCHALYTIFENFIRNASKHYEKPHKETNITLPVFTIEIKEPQNTEFSNDFYEVTIRDNRPDSCRRQILIDLLTHTEEGARWVDNEGRINPDAWGLKETKLSANFLRMGEGFKDKGTMGLPIVSYHCDGLSDSPHCSTRAKAESIDENRCKGECRLTLCIFLRKPKAFYMNCKNKGNFQDTGEGVFKAEFKGNRKRKDFPHTLFITPEPPGSLNPNYPCRLLTFKEAGVNGHLRSEDEFYLVAYEKFIFQKLMGPLHNEAPPEAYFWGIREAENFSQADFKTSPYPWAFDGWEQLDSILETPAPKLCFVYHADDPTKAPKVKKIINHPRVDFFQPLSGKYPSLKRFQNLPPDKRVRQNFFLATLEAAMTRILIIDERISKMASKPWKHGFTNRTLWEKMNIFVLDIEDKTSLNNDTLFQKVTQYLNKTIPGKQPHFMVVHQDILRRAETACETQIKANWKVIASGRGKPSEIKENMRFVGISGPVLCLNNFDKHSLTQILFSARHPNDKEA